MLFLVIDCNLLGELVFVGDSGRATERICISYRYEY